MKSINRKILVTGSAGFIGSALALRLLERGDTVIGIDNHNNYYDPALKEARLARHAKHPNYTHLRIDLADRQAIQDAFKTHQPQRVVNLAAQAGVRYQRLLLVVQGLKKLFADEHFVTLLRAEGLDTLPKYLAERISNFSPKPTNATNPTNPITSNEMTTPHQLEGARS